MIEDIKQIFQPIQKNLSLDFFCYHRVYPDSYEYMLSSDGAWQTHFHQQGHQVTGTIENDLGLDYKLNLWPMESNALILQDIRDVSDIQQGFTLFSESHNFYEFFGFGGKNIDVLQLNKQINSTNILFPYCREFKKRFEELSSFNKLQKIRITNKNNKKLSASSYKLTKREFSIVEELCQGFATREIAERLSLSMRTVEDYIANVKGKLYCSSLNELRDLVENKFIVI